MYLKLYLTLAYNCLAYHLAYFLLQARSNLYKKHFFRQDLLVDNFLGVEVLGTA